MTDTPRPDAKQTVRELGLVFLAGEWAGDVLVVPVAADHWHDAVRVLSAKGCPFLGMVATDERARRQAYMLRAFFGVPGRDFFVTLLFPVDKYTESFPSLVPVLPAAAPYEREIATLFGLLPTGNGVPERTLPSFAYPANAFPLRKDFDWNEKLDPIAPDIRNAAPVVPHLGMEKLCEGASPDKMYRLLQEADGIGSIAARISAAQAIETLAEVPISEVGQFLRVALIEAERIVHYLGMWRLALLASGDVRAATRMAKLSLEARLFAGALETSCTGSDTFPLSRLSADVTTERLLTLLETADALAGKMQECMEDGEAESPALLGTGIHRAGWDARVFFPRGGYRALDVRRKDAGVATSLVGEIRESLHLIREALALLPHLPVEPASPDSAVLSPDRTAFSLLQGLDGARATFLMTDGEGKLSRAAFWRA